MNHQRNHWKGPLIFGKTFGSLWPKRGIHGKFFLKKLIFHGIYAALKTFIYRAAEKSFGSLKEAKKKRTLYTFFYFFLFLRAALIASSCSE